MGAIVDVKDLFGKDIELKHGTTPLEARYQLRLLIYYAVANKSKLQITSTRPLSEGLKTLLQDPRVKEFVELFP